MGPPPELEEAVSTAQERLTEFRTIVEKISQDWVPKQEIDQLREELARLKAERDAWRHKYETLNESLISAAGSITNGPTPRSSLLDVPYSLQVGDNTRCKIQPVAGGQIVMDCITLNHNALHWNRRPTTVLIMKKPNVEHITSLLHEMSSWLKRSQGITVYVPLDTIQELLGLGYDVSSLDEYSPVVQLDFAISLGGDGTILYLANMFESAVPPIVSFAMGSLGFLTPFAYSDYKRVLACFIEKGMPLSIRNRLDCTVKKQGAPARHEVVMNEVVVDRGTSAHLTNLDCYVDEHYCTTVQGDGCIISTPTGSTAYSLSAGGSICHPQVPCMILTPISPHSLSFRPVVFQHSIHFRITLSKEARDNAWVSFDGRNRVLLEQGDEMLVQHSRFPVAVVCAANETQDWLQSVTGCLRWNSRDQQKGWKSAGCAHPPRHQSLSPTKLGDSDDPLQSVRKRCLRFVPDSQTCANRRFTINDEPLRTPPCSPINPPTSPMQGKSIHHGMLSLSSGALVYSPSVDSLDSIGRHPNLSSPLSIPLANLGHLLPQSNDTEEGAGQCSRVDPQPNC